MILVAFRRAATALAIFGLGFSGLPGCAEPTDSGEAKAGDGAEEALGEAQQAAAVTPTFCGTYRRAPATPAFDASVYVNKPTTNYGAAGSIIVSGGSSTNPASVRYGLFRFDLSSIPADATVLNAGFTLTQTHNGVVTGNLHRILAPWVEATVTWDSFAGAFDPAVLKTFSNATAKITIDVLPTVKSWVSGALPNHGFLVETPGDFKTTFDTQEWAVLAQRPYISSCYKVICDASHADCNNSAPDGCETDIHTIANCGGCGQVCSFPHAAAACGAGICTLGACAPGFANCDGNPANGCETDLASDASCGACGVTCSAVNGTASCVAGACQLATCDDFFLDCDGNPANGCEAAPCSDGSVCAGGFDCASGVCTGGLCAVPTCNDLVLNGTESDLDCGGVCAPCADTLVCTVPADCQSGVCAGDACQFPVCFDGVKNGAETSIDCGGPGCPSCATGQACASGSDCQSGVCVGGVCNAPSCNDSVKNGTETDVDCGGPACAKCATAKTCASAGDCQSSVCVGGVCNAPSCNDSVKNGAETDVDCGGACAAKCGSGMGCNAGGDCQNAICAGGLCLPPVCGDGVTNGAEGCDDGNVTSGDGCSASCAVQAGYACFGAPSACATICGDGVIVGSETCDDGNLTSGDGCSASCLIQAGYACNGAPSVCAAFCSSGVDDGNACTTDTCNPATGQITHTAVNIDDGDACTTDACNPASGVSHTSAVTCSALDSCHSAGVCNPATGACSNPVAANGTVCNDGNACTQSDTCQAGSCTGQSPVTCSASDQCHAAGSCNPASGACSNPTVADGTSCNDNNASTSNDVCTSGTCAGTVSGGSLPVGCAMASDNTVWCATQTVNQTGSQICGYPDGYAGTYYAITAAGATALGKPIIGYGDCATNYYSGNGIQGSSMACWTDAQRWARNGAVVNGNAIGGNVVRCTNLEGGAGTCSTTSPTFNAQYAMDTHSHGGGYSPSAHEFWYPEWAGNTVYRYNDAHQALGSFASQGNGQIMQLWGDSDGSYYTANWGYGTVQKLASAGGAVVWTYNTGDTMSGVAADATYVYAMNHYTGNVWQLNKATGALVTQFALSGGSFNTMYGGLAVVGGKLFRGDFSGHVDVYDLATHQLSSSFNMPQAGNIYNMAFTGTDYCVSPNSSTVTCYTIAACSGGSLPAGCVKASDNTVWCATQTVNQTGSQICGYPDGYAGTYYAITAAGATALGKPIIGYGDCATNYYSGNGIQGSTMSCWTDAQRWARNGAVVNGAAIGGNVVRCTNLETGAGTCSTTNPTFNAQYAMDTHSHGGGYSPSAHEFWYPEWAGNTVYRYNDAHQALGSFASQGNGQIMQLWGDSDGSYYTANWGYNTIQKLASAGGAVVWTYNTGDTMSGVTADASYVYAMSHSSATVWQLNKATGALVTQFALSGGSFATMYGGLALVGGKLFRGDNAAHVDVYDLATHQLSSSFNMPQVSNIYNMAFTGTDYCVSPNSSTVTCYTIATCSAGGGALPAGCAMASDSTVWCATQTVNQTGSQICGYPDGYAGTYYAITAAGATALGKPIIGYGDCATNYYSGNGIQGSTMACWTDAQRWARNGAVVNGNAIGGNVVRCTNLEGGGGGVAYATAHVDSGSKDLAFVYAPSGTTLNSNADYQAFCESKGFKQNLNSSSYPAFANAGMYDPTNYYCNQACCFLGTGNSVASSMSNFQNHGLSLGTPLQVFDRGCAQWATGSFTSDLNTSDTLTVNGANSASYTPSAIGGGSNYAQPKTGTFSQNGVVVCQVN